MYGFIDKSDLEIILKTCNNTDNPPRPSKKLVKIIINEIFFNFIEVIKLIPFVISKTPVTNEVIIWVGILNLVHIGVEIKFNILINLLEFKIEIITEKSITNPPIIKTVFIDDFMLLESISPRFAKDTFCNLFYRLEVL